MLRRVDATQAVLVRASACLVRPAARSSAAHIPFTARNSEPQRRANVTHFAASCRSPRCDEQRARSIQCTVNGITFTGASAADFRNFPFSAADTFDACDAAAPRTSSVHKIDHGAVSPVQEPNELSEVWRGDVIVDGVKIAMIRHVQRVETKAHVVRLAIAGT